MNRSYSEMILLPTFKERFEYLKLSGSIGVETFGHDRYLNQILYNSAQWHETRRQVIIRDNGCDLACDGYEISSLILVHHINPISIDDIVNKNFKVFDMNNLVLTSHQTHNAIHYGADDLPQFEVVERKPNDTCPWKH